MLETTHLNKTRSEFEHLVFKFKDMEDYRTYAGEVEEISTEEYDQNLENLFTKLHDRIEACEKLFELYPPIKRGIHRTISGKLNRHMLRVYSVVRCLKRYGASPEWAIGKLCEGRRNNYFDQPEYMTKHDATAFIGMYLRSNPND